jgi:hypothetical protein
LAPIGFIVRGREQVVEGLRRCDLVAVHELFMSGTAREVWPTCSCPLPHGWRSWA